LTKFYVYIGCLLIILLAFSCKSKEVKLPTTITVETADFEDAIEIEGLVQPVQVSSIQTPGSVDGVVLYIVEDGTNVKAGDTVCVLEDKGLKERYNKMKLDIESSMAALNKTKAELEMKYSLLEAQVESNAAETEIANLDSADLKFTTLVQSRIKKLELEKVSIEKFKLQKRLKSLSIINQSIIRGLEIRNRSLTARLESAKRELDGLKLTAPKDGLATRARHWMTGRKVLPTDPVWDGMPLVIIPEMDKMKVMISATEGEYKRISVNDSVQYSFDAMPNNKAWGKIRKKASVGQPIKENSKVKFFEIEASMDKSLLIPGPDLTAHCKIILKQIPDTIVIPQVCIFEEDSMKFVYVQKAKTFEKRQITVGTTSAKEAVVTAGLKRNEKIALVQPESILINGKRMLAKPKVIKKLNKSLHNK
jgi:multidrug efflux pump subunit AcrA (membrane-fusion protein)